MTAKYRLILLATVLCAVFAYHAVAGTPTHINSDPPEVTTVKYKTLLFILDDVESNTVHAIDKFIDEYYIDWNNFYKRFYEQTRKKTTPKQHKKT